MQLFLQTGLSPHKLRHTCLTLLYRERVDLMTLKELAGHEDIGSTEIYAHVDVSDVRKAVEKHPAGVNIATTNSQRKACWNEREVLT